MNPSHAPDHESAPYPVTGIAVARPGLGESALRTVVYRSRAKRLPDDRELQCLLEHARQRNRQHAVTGLLVYDDGVFFQWLEGPARNVAALWRSIRDDARHEDLELLGEQSIPVRAFRGWDMRLAWNADDRHPALAASFEVPASLLDRLHADPSPTAAAWNEFAALGAASTSPSLGLSIGIHEADIVYAHEPVPVLADEDDVTGEMARCVLSLDPRAAGRFIAELRGRGLSAETLYLDLFESVAQRLGDWCDDDRCNEAEVSIAMSRLQSLVRQLGPAFSRLRTTLAFERSTLVATQPGEPHGLRLALDTEFFWRAGWQVDIDFPTSDAALGQRLHRQWFDVLDLSLSSAYRSERQLSAMAGTIRAARAASLNPALVVIVAGRVFGEHPEYGLLVSADAGCATPARSLVDAGELLRAVQRPYFAAAQRALHGTAHAVHARAFRTSRGGGARFANA